MLKQQGDVTSTLFEQIQQWVQHQPGWTAVTRKIPDQLQEAKHDNKVNSLHIQTQQGKIHLEPIGLDKNGKYIVEMYAWPTLVRVFLAHLPKDDQWEVLTDAGLPFHWEWNEANFVRLANDLQILP